MTYLEKAASNEFLAQAFATIEDSAHKRVKKLLVACADEATRLVIAQTGVQQKLGAAVFMPSIFGWAGAIGVVIAVMLGWAALATWNEASGKFSAF